jgi:hypothetical protein
VHFQADRGGVAPFSHAPTQSGLVSCENRKLEYKHAHFCNLKHSRPFHIRYGGAFDDREWQADRGCRPFVFPPNQGWPPAKNATFNINMHVAGIFAIAASSIREALAGLCSWLAPVRNGAHLQSPRTPNAYHYCTAATHCDIFNGCVHFYRRMYYLGSWILLYGTSAKVCMAFAPGSPQSGMERTSRASHSEHVRRTETPSSIIIDVSVLTLCIVFAILL